jgi:hypothetical protein
VGSCVFGIEVFGRVHTHVSVSFFGECEGGRPGLVSPTILINWAECVESDMQYRYEA